MGEDSEFEDLVAEGREEHPLVRYTRLVRDKKAELEYVYNPVGRSRSFRNTHALAGGGEEQDEEHATTLGGGQEDRGRWH